MRIAVLELPAVWNGKAEALARVETMLAAGPETDLVLLPEAALTGFVSPDGDFDLAPFAEPPDGPSAQRFAALARRHRTHLVGPLIVAEGGAAYNALAVFGRDGDVLAWYRKRHPWYPETWASPGSDPHPVLAIDGHAVSLAICFDVHFLAAEEAELLTRIDLLLFASAWVEDRPGDRSLEPILDGLSVRFDLAIANANWGPGVVQVAGQGGSSIRARGGRVVAVVGPGELRADAELSPAGG